MKLGEKFPCCMNGEWKMLKTRKYMPVSDSSTGELIAEVPCCTLDEVDSVVQAAHQAFPAWSV